MKRKKLTFGVVFFLEQNAVHDESVKKLQNKTNNKQFALTGTFDYKNFFFNQYRHSLKFFMCCCHTL